MRIERVVAVAFGPFRGETLDLAPGLNVISGPNEAGKSSWHAAVRAAICGARRARGRPGEADAAFAALHRPWDRPEQWEVEARLTLDDGRRIEIRQDLSDRVDSRAVDRDLGRDVSSEIIYDGAPDASRWLGLTRETFVRTVCIDQADVLSITASAAALQEQLQRAAATHGTDATAAEALSRLNTFRAEEVGTERAPTRPLLLARGHRDRTRIELDEARRAHLAYLELVERADAAREAAGHARKVLRRVEAALAAREAAELGRRASRAHELAALHPVEPAGLPARDELADQVAAAIDGWANRPAVPLLDGDTAETLRAQLAALPEEPAGELAPVPEVVDARNAWLAARQAEGLAGPAPAVPPAPATGGLREVDLRRTAADLQATALSGGGEPPRVVRPVSTPPYTRAALPAGVAVASLLLTAGAVLAGSAVVALVAALVAVVFGGLALLAWRTAAAPGTGDADSGRQDIAYEAARARRDEAVARAQSAGLAADPGTLSAVADAVAAHEQAASEHRGWQERASIARERVAAAAPRLAAALTARGEAPGSDLEGAWEAYVVACATRAEQHERAARAGTLRQAISAREEAEAAAAMALERVAAAEAGLRAAAARAGFDVDVGPDALVVALRRAQGLRAEAARSHERALREWQELRSLLGAGTVGSLDALAAAGARRARTLADGFDDATIASTPLEPDPPAQLAMLRDAVEARARAADQLAGEVASTKSRLPGVPEAQEAYERACAEVGRLEQLGATIDQTIALLSAAQQRVHRDLAPVLADAVRPGLAAVTGGRYVDVAVDPATLQVRVKEAPASGGHWRGGDVVSRGTREQIYLLLRAAMAQHLVTEAETAPLLLDEVTAQSDDEREAAILDVLLEISADRQVLVFSHDPTVVQWARAHLGDRDRLVELPPPAGPDRLGDAPG
jgi:exonuclease SbcC